MLALRLPHDIESQLDRLAKSTGLTKSFYAQEANIEHITYIDELYLAEKRLVKNRNGKTKIFSLASVGAELGLAN